MFKHATIVLTSLFLGSLSFAAQTTIPNVDGFKNLCSTYLSLSANFAVGEGDGITETQYNAVLDKIQKMYGAEVTAHNATLTINRKWTSKTVNSSASQMFGHWSITMDGGLARAPGMNRDAFALVACHEMGHHLGGAPHQLLSIEGISSEGEADYFSTLKCLRTFFADEDNAAAVKAEALDPFVVAECTQEHTDVNDQLICERSAMAGWVIDHVLQKVNHDKSVIAFSTPDQTDPILVSAQSHPKAQCRLDTFFNGARCPVAVSSALSNTSPYPGSCDQAGAQANTGSRPRCWFKPSQAQ